MNLDELKNTPLVPCGFCGENTWLFNLAEDSDICITCDVEVYGEKI
jgi:hypothetical protein